MAKKEQLRKLREGTVINEKSNKQEKILLQAVKQVKSAIEKELEIELRLNPMIYVKDIVTDLKASNLEINFSYFNDTSFLKPDGGILYFEVKPGLFRPILIAEAKRQGTNDDREKEGKTRQAKGNAIERLGKNVIGFRTWLANEKIFPFVVFGQGVDFEEGSSILDRVSTIAMFAPLNEVHLLNEGECHDVARGSFYFRSENWSEDEMCEVLYPIARGAIDYYTKVYLA